MAGMAKPLIACGLGRSDNTYTAKLPTSDRSIRLFGGWLVVCGRVP